VNTAENEENLLRSAAMQNADSVLLTSRRAQAASEQKNDELTHAVSMLRATLESTTDGIMVADDGGRITNFNARFVQTWGLPPEIVETREHQKWLDFISPQLADAVKFQATVRAIIHSLSPASLDVLECADGRVLECHTKVQRIGERIVGRVWSLRDITERRKAESILRRSEKILADLFDNAAIGLHFIGTDGRILRVNRTELEMLGYSQEEFVGHFIEEFYVDAPVVAGISPKLMRGEDLDNHETRLRCKDGSIKDVLISCNGFWEDGKLVHSRCFTHDVTEKKRAETVRARLASLVESSADAIVSKTLDGTICTWNKGAEQMFGYTAEDVVGKSIMVLIPSDRATEEACILERLKRGESIDHYETVRQRKDGTLIDISLTVSPIRDAKGSVIGASKIARDITGRKQTEAALRTSEARFRQLADAMPQMVWTTRPDGHVDYLNRRWYDYTGMVAGKGGDESWTPFIHPDDLQRCLDVWRKSLETGELYQIEYRLKNRAGEYRWHLGRALATRNEEGEIVRWYGSCTDIHEQKLTAEALRVEYTVTEHFNAVARALATELDPGRVVRIVTDAGTRMTRAEFGGFFHHRVDDDGTPYVFDAITGLAGPDLEKIFKRSVAALIRSTLRGDGIIRLDDVRNDRRFGPGPAYGDTLAGPLFVASYLAVPVIARSGEVLGGLFFGHAHPGMFTERDEENISALAAQAAAAMNTASLYQAEQQARRIAEQANQTKDDFLAALSHELRTPLTPVLAILSSIREDPTVPPALAADLEMMLRSVELETRLIDDLLDLTRITRGKLELHLEPSDINHVIENAIRTCEPELNAKRLMLVRDFQTREQMVLADRTRITQVLWNLLTNSIKFTPAGGIITVRSSKSSTGGIGQVTIVVEDNGIGMAPDHVTRVFDAFEQGDRNITRQFGGLGLGLAISKAIAISHRGTISASSNGLGRGSSFMLTLPCDNCEGLHPTMTSSSHNDVPTTSESASFSPRSRPLRILLVEDHGNSAAIISRLLRRSGHEVAHAATVADALLIADQAMRSAGLDLVVSDLGLPDGSGLDMMRKLSTDYGLRGIALSGFGMDSDRAESRAAGFSRHLTKPIDIADLRNAIDDLAQIL
jgi:PAS domain S-box-containing protein